MVEKRCTRVYLFAGLADAVHAGLLARGHTLFSYRVPKGTLTVGVFCGLSRLRACLAGTAGRACVSPLQLAGTLVHAACLCAHRNDPLKTRLRAVLAVRRKFVAVFASFQAQMDIIYIL